MKFVHAADLHIDSPLYGLCRYEGAPLEQIRGATRRALENLVKLCVDEAAELLVLAGDLYDDDWRDYATGLFFAAQMAVLREAGVSVVWIRGNHDAASKLTHHLRLPDNVRELSHKHPETFVLDQLGVAVHGQSFPTRDVEEDLSARYPARLRDHFNIGLLHTALEGRDLHARYAPCQVPALVNHGYEYWALGHVHRREVVKSEPWIVFPGNLQGRHARETGDKGATLVDVQGGRVSSLEHRALDVVRWFALDVDASSATDLDGVLDAVRERLQSVVVTGADGRLAAVRVRIVGSSSAHAELERSTARLEAEVRALALDLRSTEVWIEKVVLALRAPKARALGLGDDALGQMLRGIRSLENDPAALTELAQEVADLRRKLPADLFEGPDALDLESEGAMRELLSEVAQSIIPSLESGAEGGS
ncbi:MAG TPA: DNA repair exonuclease [Polyangiaceae bacterium]